MNSSNNKADYIDFLDNNRNQITTNIGKWVGGDDVTIRGYSLFKELFNQVSYFQLLVLNVTGRLIERNLAIWLENNFMVMSYPDARIWCNQISALAGTLQSSASSATAAGGLAADSRAYGGSHTSKLAMEFIINALSEYKNGKTVEQIINSSPKSRDARPAITGFFRPVEKKDERIEPHKKMSAELGFAVGEHMALANEISEYISTHYPPMGINIGGYTAAFMADQGFSPEELYQIKCLCVTSGATACYIDTLNKPENAFLPQRCDDIHYTGHPKRSI